MFFLRKQNQSKPSFNLQYNLTFNNKAPVTTWSHITPTTHSRLRSNWEISIKLPKPTKENVQIEVVEILEAPEEQKRKCLDLFFQTNRINVSMETGVGNSRWAEQKTVRKCLDDSINDSVAPPQKPQPVWNAGKSEFERCLLHQSHTAVIFTDWSNCLLIEFYTKSKGKKYEKWEEKPLGNYCLYDICSKIQQLNHLMFTSTPTLTHNDSWIC